MQEMVIEKTSIHDIVPSELLAEIALHLTGNTKALKSLSLVSHTWTPTAQRYLFSTMTVQSDTLPGKKGKPEDLLALLEKAPHLAAYVAHLTISEERDRGREKWDALLCRFLPLFQNIKRLSLGWAQGRWWSGSPASPESTLKCFEVLKTTFQTPVLAHVDFTRVPISWTQYLSPTVKNLGIRNPYLDKKLDIASTEKTPNGKLLSHVQLNILLVDGLNWATCSQVGDAVRYLMQAGLGVSKLRKLGLGLVSSPYTAHEDVMVLLRKCAGSLRELSITPSFASYSPARGDYTDILNLSILRKLRALHIGVQAGIVHNERDIEPMLWLLPQLKQFPTNNNLRDIIFACEYTVYETVHNRSYFGLSFDSYGELDTEVLTSARFPKLTRFMNYIEDPNRVPSQQLILWLLSSLYPHTKRLRERKVFVDRYGPVYRNNIFPANTPW